MNWKKEGYEVGDKAYLIKSSFYGGVYSTGEVEVIYRGSKILKIQDGNRIVEFKSKISSIYSWGDTYAIYKNKEEYDNEIRLKKERVFTIEYIKDNLNKMNEEELASILFIIDAN